MLPELVAIEWGIFLQPAKIIEPFAVDTGWEAIAVVLPASVFLGAVHALTREHGRALLVAFVPEDPSRWI